jgi:hypothetical protein
MTGTKDETCRNALLYRLVLSCTENWALPQFACCLTLYLGDRSDRRWLHVHDGLPRAVVLAVYHTGRTHNQPRAAYNCGSHYRGRTGAERSGLPGLRHAVTMAP